MENPSPGFRFCKEQQVKLCTQCRCPADPVPGSDTWKWALGSNPQLLGVLKASFGLSLTSESWYSPAQHRTFSISYAGCFWTPWVFFTLWDIMWSTFFPSFWDKQLNYTQCGTLLPLFRGLIAVSACNHLVIVQQLIVPCWPALFIRLLACSSPHVCFPWRATQVAFISSQAEAIPSLLLPSCFIFSSFFTI